MAMPPEPRATLTRTHAIVAGVLALMLASMPQNLTALLDRGGRDDALTTTAVAAARAFEGAMRRIGVPEAHEALRARFQRLTRM